MKKFILFIFFNLFFNTYGNSVEKICLGNTGMVFNPIEGSFFLAPTAVLSNKSSIGGSIDFSNIIVKDYGYLTCFINARLKNFVGGVVLDAKSNIKDKKSKADLSLVIPASVAFEIKKFAIGGNLTYFLFSLNEKNKSSLSFSGSGMYKSFLGDFVISFNKKNELGVNLGYGKEFNIRDVFIIKIAAEIHRLFNEIEKLTEKVKLGLDLNLNLINLVSLSFKSGIDSKNLLGGFGVTVLNFIKFNFLLIAMPLNSNSLEHKEDYGFGISIGNFSI